MADIQRYKVLPHIYMGKLSADPAGDLVTHADHLAKVAELQAEIERLKGLVTWKPLISDTIFDTDKWYILAGFNSTAGSFYQCIDGSDFQRSGAAQHLLNIGRIHYRPINPPEATNAE